MAIQNPHFAFPFRSAGTGFAQVEQDSDADILACAYAVAATQVGARDEEPEFGTPEQAFRQGGADLDEIEAALGAWEPRSDAVAETVEFADLLQRVRVEV